MYLRSCIAPFLAGGGFTLAFQSGNPIHTENYGVKKGTALHLSSIPSVLSGDESKILTLDNKFPSRLPDRSLCVPRVKDEGKDQKLDSTISSGQDQLHFIWRVAKVRDLCFATHKKEIT